jgi:hypothetical protein
MCIPLLPLGASQIRAGARKSRRRSMQIVADPAMRGRRRTRMGPDEVRPASMMFVCLSSPSSRS